MKIVMVTLAFLLSLLLGRVLLSKPTPERPALPVVSAATQPPNTLEEMQNAGHEWIASQAKKIQQDDERRKREADKKANWDEQFKLLSKFKEIGGISKWSIDESELWVTSKFMLLDYDYKMKWAKIFWSYNGERSAVTLRHSLSGKVVGTYSPDTRLVME